MIAALLFIATFWGLVLYAALGETVALFWFAFTLIGLLAAWVPVRVGSRGRRAR